MIKRINISITLLILISLSSIHLIGQDLIDYHEITILSTETKVSLPGATALNLRTGNGETADGQGIIRIKKEDIDDRIEFSYLGFQKKQLLLSELTDTIYLVQDLNVLENITILSEIKPTELTDKSETISDFIMDADRIIQLSKVRGQKNILKLTDLNGRQLYALELTDIKYIEKLFTSCFDTHYLLGRSTVLQLLIQYDRIKIVHRETRDHFDKFILPCKTQNGEFIYIEKRQVKDQIATIFGYHKKGGEPFQFARITDDDNLDKYKHDAPYMNFADGTGPLYLGIHAENPRDAIQWGDMLNHNFYLPIDYHMMSYKDKVLIFDHEKFKLNVFDPKGNLIEEHDIDYPKHKSWKSRSNLIVDNITGKIYAKHREGNHLCFTEVDPESGVSRQQYKIEASFIQNFAIHNNYIYYTNSSIVEPSRILKKISL